MSAKWSIFWWWYAPVFLCCSLWNLQRKDQQQYRVFLWIEFLINSLFKINDRTWASESENNSFLFKHVLLFLRFKSCGSQTVKQRLWIIGKLFICFPTEHLRSSYRYNHSMSALVFQPNMVGFPHSLFFVTSFDIPLWL